MLQVLNFVEFYGPYNENTKKKVVKLCRQTFSIYFSPKCMSRFRWYQNGRLVQYSYFIRSNNEHLYYILTDNFLMKISPIIILFFSSSVLVFVTINILFFLYWFSLQLILYLFIYFLSEHDSSIIEPCIICRVYKNSIYHACTLGLFIQLY